MLSIFRQLEEKNSHEQVPTGPKPLKCFTPPPEPARGESESEGDEEGSSEEDEEEHESETEQSSNVVRAVDKPTDEFLIQVSSPGILNPKIRLTKNFEILHVFGDFGGKASVSSKEPSSAKSPAKLSCAIP